MIKNEKCIISNNSPFYPGRIGYLLFDVQDKSKVIVLTTDDGEYLSVAGKYVQKAN